jgi:hypothetical protein
VNNEEAGNHKHIFKDKFIKKYNGNVGKFSQKQYKRVTLKNFESVQSSERKHHKNRRSIVINIAKDVTAVNN